MPSSAKDAHTSHALAIPAPLVALLARGGMTAAHVDSITTLPGATSARATYRIALADGRVVKGRIVTDADRARKMARWIPALPPDRFPRLLATAGDATLETWMDGSPPSAEGEALLEEAGGLLGEIHHLVPPTRLTADAARVRDWWREVKGWLASLRHAGLVDDALAARARARIEEAPAAGATWGLCHGDFSLDNLIAGDAGLCCVDNATVAPGLLESDLAQTVYRWPMDAAERRAFMRGYRRSGIETTFEHHERLWMVAATLRAAAFRQRVGSAAVGEALRVLAIHA